MPDVYGVVPADVAAELPGLFPGGFAVSTVPTLGQVASFIAVADLKLSLVIQNAAGIAPASDDRAVPLAKRTIIERVKAQVIRIVYTGNAPEQVDQAARPYEDLANEGYLALAKLTTQAVGTGETPNRMHTSDVVPVRDLLVSDCELGLPPVRGRY